MDRRLAEHGRRLDALEDRVDFFVRTQTPPLQGVFYDGQLWDARAFVDRLVKSARKSLLLVDNWATVETLDMLAAKQKGVSVTVVTSEHRDLYLIGASLKDLGKKCFAFTKLDTSEIAGLKARM